MGGSRKVDQWGRPLSDDGRWFWDGAAWRAHHEPQPATADPAPPGPQHGFPHHDQLAPFDPAAEAGRYPVTWRLTARALRDVPRLLAPGEIVLATAPGKTSFPRVKSLDPNLFPEYWGPSESLVVVTDRRLLVLRLTMTSGGVSFTQPFPFETITYWSSRSARTAAVGPRSGVIEVACEPHEAAAVERIPLDLFGAVCGAIEARLSTGVRRA